MSSENPIWTLPEGHDYAIEFWADSKWMRREDYGPINYLRQQIPQMHHTKCIRIVKVSRYPPHPAQAVVYYKEEKE